MVGQRRDDARLLAQVGEALFQGDPVGEGEEGDPVREAQLVLERGLAEASPIERQRGAGGQGHDELAGYDVRCPRARARSAERIAPVGWGGIAVLDGGAQAGGLGRRAMAARKGAYHLAAREGEAQAEGEAETATGRHGRTSGLKASAVRSGRPLASMPPVTRIWRAETAEAASRARAVLMEGSGRQVSVSGS
ncbi:hypothetical protein D3C86_1301330 [compost metagenome]